MTLPRKGTFLGFDAYDEEDRGHTTPCWIYRKKPTAKGYCQMSMPDGSQPCAHRAYYEHYVGPIPAGLTLDHGCEVRNCVNPAHLTPMTLVENVMHGDSPHARNARKTHCANGHPYDAENTYVTTKGERACRTCHRTWRAARHARSQKAKAQHA